MAENSIRVFAPNEPLVYFGNIPLYRWHVGMAAAVIGALGLFFDDDRKRKNLYDTLVVRGTSTFLEDLPNFVNYIESLFKKPPTAQ